MMDNIAYTSVIKVKILEPQPIKIKILEPQPIKVNIGAVSVGGSIVYPQYEGSYEVTPTQETQILPTTKTRLENDIVVNPIPSNYGLITWNGSFIRVS